MGKGQKIIDGLKDAVEGNFSRVTVAGQTWVRLDTVTTMEECIRHIVRDELVRCHVVKDCSDDI